LEGRSIEGLSAICGNCHEGIEFHEEVKLNLRHANTRLKRQTKDRKQSRETAAMRENREFRDKLKHIKKTLFGAARNLALAEAYRERTASIK
jgi:hypothetical protein